MQKVLRLVRKSAVYDLKIGLLGKPTTVWVYARNFEEGDSYIMKIAEKYKDVELLTRTDEGDLIFKSKSFGQARAFAKDVGYSVHTKG